VCVHIYAKHLQLTSIIQSFSAALSFQTHADHYAMRSEVKVFPRWGNCLALRAPPVHFLGCCFNSGLSNYQWSTECIKHDFRLFIFNFVKFCKNIQHCEFVIVKMWNLNDLLTIGWLLRRLLTCWAQEPRFRLWNRIILQPESSRLKFSGPGTAFRCVPAYFNPWVLFFKNSLCKCGSQNALELDKAKQCSNI